MNEQQKNWTAYVFDFKKWVDALYQKHIGDDDLFVAYVTEHAYMVGLTRASVGKVFPDGECVFLRYKNKPAISIVSPQGHSYVIPFSDVVRRGLMLGQPSDPMFPPPFRKRIKWDKPQFLFYPLYRCSYLHVYGKGFQEITVSADPRITASRDKSFDSFKCAIKEAGWLKTKHWDFNRVEFDQQTEEELNLLIREKLGNCDIPEFGSAAEVPPLQREMPDFMQAALEKVGYRTYQLEGPKPSVPERTGEAVVVFDKQTQQYRVAFCTNNAHPPEHAWTIKDREDA